MVPRHGSVVPSYKFTEQDFLTQILIVNENDDAQYSTLSDKVCELCRGFCTCKEFVTHILFKIYYWAMFIEKDKRIALSINNKNGALDLLKLSFF